MRVSTFYRHPPIGIRAPGAWGQNSYESASTTLNRERGCEANSLVSAPMTPSTKMPYTTNSEKWSCQPRWATGDPSWLRLDVNICLTIVGVPGNKRRDLIRVGQPLPAATLEVGQGSVNLPSFLAGVGRWSNCGSKNVRLRAFLRSHKQSG